MCAKFGLAEFVQRAKYLGTYAVHFELMSIEKSEVQFCRLTFIFVYFHFVQVK